MAIEDFDQVTIEAVHLRPFSKFIMSIGELPTSYLDSLSYAEQITWFCDYLQNNVIPAINNNADALEEVQTLMTQLQEYVDNYFTNLDVQEEINNKLDSMVESGELTALIGAYVDPRLITFENTVNTRLQNQDLTIANLQSSSPLIVSATSKMIDPTKVYVLSSNMHIYYYNGSQFVDSTIAYAGGTAIMSGYYSLLNTSTMWESFSNDFNNLVANKIYLCNQPSSVVLTNAPYSTFNGLVMCFNHRDTTTSGLFQLAHNPTRGLYYRECWGTTWGSWKHIATTDDLSEYANAVLGYGSIINTSTAWTAFENDFNNLLPNKIYTVQNTNGVTQLHTPTGSNVSGTVYSFSYKNGNYDGETQLFINAANNHIYYRIRWGGSWHDWTDLISDGYINPTLNNRYDELYKVFDTVGIIGDSLASGESAYKDGSTTKYIDIYEKSWGQFMARDSGNTYYNFSNGGLNTRTWFTTTEGYPTASDGNHNCKAYIIGLGVNDQILGSDYVGSSADIDLNDYTQNADTFYGNYAKIIQTMKIQQPKAKFFLLTVPNVASSYDDFNTAIRYMATIFDNVYIIDLRQDHITYFNTGTFIINNRRSGHFNAIAYEYIAKMFEQWISEYIYNNYTEFIQVEFIGTEYEWTE